MVKASSCSCKFYCVFFLSENGHFIEYSGAHKRSDAYSNLLSKPQLLSMTWQTFKTLQPPWQSGSKQILIGGFQKCKTCPCASRGCKVTGYQSFSIEKIKSVHRWRCFHMKIWYIKRNVQFLKNEKVWQPVTLQPLEANRQVVPFWKPPIS